MVEGRPKKKKGICVCMWGEGGKCYRKADFIYRDKKLKIIQDNEKQTRLFLQAHSPFTRLFHEKMDDFLSKMVLKNLALKKSLYYWMISSVLSIFLKLYLDKLFFPKSYLESLI